MGEVRGADESIEGEDGLDDADQVSSCVTRWVKFEVVMSTDAFEIVARARELLEEMGVSHEVEAVAWGKVLELLAADFIASGWIDDSIEVP